jgi:hypothetical protein
VGGVLPGLSLQHGAGAHPLAVVVTAMHGHLQAAPAAVQLPMVPAALPSLPAGSLHVDSAAMFERAVELGLDVSDALLAAGRAALHAPDAEVRKARGL